MNHLISKIRIVTAASLFDGHDVAINIMRRIFQSKGAEASFRHNRLCGNWGGMPLKKMLPPLQVTGRHIEFF